MDPQFLLKSNRRHLLFGLVFLACALLCAVGSADTLLLANGQVRSSLRLVEREPDGTISVETEMGIGLTFRESEYLVITDEDLVVLEDGGYKVGRLISEDAAEVNFDSGDGPETFPRSSVKQVVPRTGAAPPPGALVVEPRKIDRAFDFIERKEFVLAAETMDLSSQDADAPAVDITRAMTQLVTGFGIEYNELLGSHKELEAARKAKDIREILGRGSLSGIIDPLLLNENLSQFQTAEAQARYSFANRILSNALSDQYPAALEQVSASIRLQDTYEGRLVAGELNIRTDNWDDAHIHLKAATQWLQDPPPPGDPVQARMWEYFNRAYNLYITQSNDLGLQVPPILARSTGPAPTPTPFQRRINVADLPTPTPLPTATPTPTPEPTPDGFVENYISRPYKAVDDWAQQQAGVPAWQLLIAAIAFWLIFFTVPQQIADKMARGGSGAASLWRGKITVLGLAAFIPMYFSHFMESRGKSSKTSGEIAPPPSLSGGGAPPKKRPWWKFWAKSAKEVEVAKDLEEMTDPELMEHISYLTRSLDLSKASRGEGAFGMDDLQTQTMQQLIQAVVTLAVMRRASDIHIEPELEGSKIRLRLDGVLYDTAELPRSLSNAFVSSLKVMADLDIAEKRISQDGKVSMRVDDADIDLRINTAPGAFAERVTLRILDSRSIQVGADALGMDGTNHDSFQQIIRRPSGVIFLTGPTGSGKTTTLCVALSQLNDGTRNILTIENPIEYHIKGINQMQVNEITGFTFAKGLRSILRSDPDVIMVGEIRDKETADTAIDAANTGHLVFTTLHTIDAPTVMPRLLDLGVEPRRAANAVLAAIAQRLARISCPHCKEPYTPEPNSLEQLGMEPEQLVDTVFYRGPGCEVCHQTGYQGRLGLFEMFLPDATLREMMEQGKSVNVIREAARRRGMRTLREEGIMRIQQGLTNVEEILRTT